MGRLARVGIAGLGWGSLVHVPAFRAADGFDVAALCGRDGGRLREAGAKWGINDLSTDWRHFVRRDDLDVISVATPPAEHRPMVECAFAAGKHVICEKPAAPTAPDVRSMLAAAEQSGQAHAVSFELRWLPEHQRLIELVESGALGTPVLVQITRNVSMWHPSCGAIPPWKFQLNEGGGFLNAVLAHDIDLVARLFGSPTAVCATTAQALAAQFGLQAGDAEDTAALLLRLQSGAMASISGTAVSPHGSVYELEAAGTEASVHLRAGADGPVLTLGRAGEPTEQVQLAARVPARRAPIPEDYPLARQVRAMALLLEDWRPALESGTSPVPGFREALLVQQVIDAARLSAAGAGWVEV
ncbi:MAG TPA: Gfo/Idh/MocA family oxidoreductase [Chloroflexota bacterium]|nr:Gfo/Idh/MocA family oxidoreductase [Chloroflexota bacterium]